jgi:hypothetical protein
MYMKILITLICYCTGIILIGALLCCQSQAQSRLEITKDNDKTVYSIESNRQQAIQEEKEDKNRAWEMLKSTGIIIDKRKAPVKKEPQTPSTSE